MRATLFHNPKAGEADWPAERLLTELRKAGLDPAYQSTKDDGFREVLAQTEGLAIAAGGDGTVAKVALGIDAERAKLAILPTGGANNIARTLRAYGAPDAVARGLGEAAERRLPIGCACGPWGERRFLEAVGLGPLAQAARETSNKLARTEKREQGRAALREGVQGAAPLAAVLTIDGETVEEPALMVEVLNIETIGPNLTLWSDAPNSGDHLAVVWVPVSARESMAAWLSAPEASPAPVSRRAGRRIEIALHGEPVRVDDQVARCGDAQMVVERRPPALTVLVPKGAS